MPTIPYVRATHSDGQPWSAAKANVVEAGINDVSFAPAVRAYHNANQSIANATWTSLALNSERFDQAGNAADTMHDTVTNNSRLTCRYAGVYLITGNAQFAASAGGNNRLLRILLNGTTILGVGGDIYNPVVNQALPQQITTVYALAVNDYVELQVYQDSTAALNVTTVANWSPEFAMARLA